MVDDFRVQELPESLVIRVHKTCSWVRAVVGGWLIGAVAFYFLFKSFHFSAVTSALIATSSSLFSGFLQHRSRTITTSINKFEAVVVGSLVYTYGPARHIPLADISSFQYFNGNTDEDSERPRGLYANLQRGSVCLVPYISAEQADPLTEKIYQRFSHIVGASAGTETTSLLYESPIQLNLNRP